MKDQIEEQIGHPTQAHLTRGLWDSLYKPLRVASVAPEGAKSPQVTQSVAIEAASVSIPINFETGKTIVDDETRPNVAILAHALADKAHGAQRFVFVGHADIRGNEAQNIEFRSVAPRQSTKWRF